MPPAPRAANVEAAHVVIPRRRVRVQQGGVARCALKTMVGGIGYTVLPANRQLRSTAVLVRPLHAALHCKDATSRLRELESARGSCPVGDELADLLGVLGVVVAHQPTTSAGLVGKRLARARIVTGAARLPILLGRPHGVTRARYAPCANV